MLRLEGLSCGYGQMRAVHELNLEAPQGEITALLGANGAGKSSTIMCIAGHVQIQGGRIIYRDRDVAGLSPVERVKQGIGLTPEGRRLFSSLTVKENLIVGGYSRPKDRTADSMDQVLSLFPRLGERLTQTAGSLSGGEQQMLAISRAMMAQPRLLLVDELSLGLMPKAIDICYEAVTTLKEQGLTIILVEQSTERAIEVADQVYVLESGRKVWSGTAAEARKSGRVIDALLGIGKETQ